MRRATATSRCSWLVLFSLNFSFSLGDAEGAQARRGRCNSFLRLCGVRKKRNTPLVARARGGSRGDREPPRAPLRSRRFGFGCSRAGLCAAGDALRDGVGASRSLCDAVRKYQQTIRSRSRPRRLRDVPSTDPRSRLRGSIIMRRFNSRDGHSHTRPRDANTRWLLVHVAPRALSRSSPPW